MKKNLITTVFVIMASFTMNAQIPNPGFEIGINSDSTIKHWFNIGSFVIGINDSVLFDGPMTSLSSNAHSGNYALELRNSYNITHDLQYNGNVSCFPDSNFGFGQFLIPITTKPTDFYFYYNIYQNQFSDYTNVKVQIFNSDEEEIGSGEKNVSAITTNYQLATFPIQYYPDSLIQIGDTIPAFAKIKFENYLDSSSIAHVGYRILIDDLSFEMPLSYNNLNKKVNVQLFPNPIKDILFINCQEQFQIQLFNAIGEVLKTDENCSSLSLKHFPRGIYFVKINGKNGTYSQSILKD